MGAHFFRFSHSAAASIHASSTEPAGSPSHAAIAAHEPGSSSGSLIVPYIQVRLYFDKRVDANFQDDGYTTWRGYALSYMYRTTGTVQGTSRASSCHPGLISLMTHVDHEAHAG